MWALLLVLGLAGCKAGSRPPGGTAQEPSPQIGARPSNARSAGDASAPVAASPWANWPMPNPVGSGLPNQQSYDTSTAGVVSDRVTGLMWQGMANTTGMYWPAARTYCQDLTLGGHDDWRLPSLIELVSLVDTSRTNPAIDGAAFSKPVGGTVWTATPIFPSQDEAWYVSFNTGFTYHGHGNLLPIDVRCVRSGRANPAAGRYAFAAGEATVSDQLTGLVWQRAVDGTTRSWQDAGKYCGTLAGAAGGGNWRVPSVKELQTILDLGRQSPALDLAVFPGSPGEQYWTSSALAGSTTDAWSVNFSLGVTNPGPRDSLDFVRCVH